jgi:tetratricopeptide (TPR) repeat protein
VETIAHFSIASVPSSLLLDALLPLLAGVSRERARCLFVLGLVRASQDQHESAQECFAEAQWLFKTLGDHHNAMVCQSERAVALQHLGRYGESAELCLEAHKAYVELEDEVNAAVCIKCLGRLAYLRGNADEAIERLTEAQTAFKRLGESAEVAQCSHFLGHVYERQDDLPAAVEALDTAWHEYERLGSETGLAQARMSLGRLMCTQGDLEAAQEHFDAAQWFYLSSADRMGSWIYEVANLRKAEGRLEEARASYREALPMLREAKLWRVAEECEKSLNNLPR